MKSADQLGRLLTLIPHLQANPGLTAAEVAQHYRTTKRQIIDELTLLWCCGPSTGPEDLIDLNMEEIEAGGPIHLGNAEYLTRPMRLTAEEAFALMVSLATIRELVSAEQASTIDQVLQKLSTLTGGVPVPRVAVEMSSASAEVREVLAEAIATGQRVRLVYDGASRGHTTQPVVDPVELTVRDGVPYLHAWSLERDDWRTYRLDRVVGAELTGEPGQAAGRPRPESRWVDAGGEPVDVVLGGEAAWWVEYDPVESVERLDAGAVAARFRVLDPAWLTKRLLQLGAGVHSVAPASAAAEAAAAAREAVKLHDLVTLC